jgi:alpha-1,6-mannosyltransferase
MVAGLALARRGRWLWGVVAVSLAMLVKAPAGLALAFLAPLTPDGGGRVWPGARRALAGLAVCAAVVVTVTTVSGLGYGWVLALRTPASVETLWSVSTDVGRLLGWLTSGPRSASWPWNVSPVTLVRSVSMVAALAAGVYWLRRAPAVGAEFALGMTLLTLVVLSPAIQPWYMLWGTIPLAVTAWRTMARHRPRALIAVLVFVLLPEGAAPTRTVLAAALLGVLLGMLLLIALFADDTAGEDRSPAQVDFLG